LKKLYSKTKGKKAENGRNDENVFKKIGTTLKFENKIKSIW
jgi:hypothetical protein